MLPLGFAPICGILPLGAGDIPSPSLTVTIDGLSVSQYLFGSEPCSITLESGKRSTLTANFIGNFSVDEGDEVRAYWDGTPIFAGKIESLDKQLPADHLTAPCVVTIDANDWARILDRFVIAYAYPTGWTLEEIIYDILYVRKPEIHIDEGITLGTVPDFELGKVNFSYETVADALSDLCDQLGLGWYITIDKVLQIYDRATFTAPWTVGDTGSQQFRNLKYSRAIGKFRNRQYVRAYCGETDPTSDSFHGDASEEDPSERRREFTLRYPLASAPVIRRNGVIQRLGIRNVDKDDDIEMANWPQWFYAVDDDKISQNSESDEVENPTLADNEVLRVNYVGRFPLTLYVTDPASINARKAAEGGSGIYDAVDEDEDLTTLDLTKEKAARLLEQYGRIPGLLKYEYFDPSLQLGHIQSIDVAGLGVDADFMVDSIDIYFPTPWVIQLQAELLDGEKQGGWFEFWKKTVKAGRKFGVREDEVVVYISPFADEFEISDDFEDSVNGTVVLPDIDDDPYTVALFGVYVMPVTGELIPRAVVGRSVFAIPFEP